MTNTREVDATGLEVGQIFLNEASERCVIAFIEETDLDVYYFAIGEETISRVRLGELDTLNVVMEE